MKMYKRKFVFTILSMFLCTFVNAKIDDELLQLLTQNEIVEFEDNYYVRVFSKKNMTELLTLLLRLVRF